MYGASIGGFGDLEQQGWTPGTLGTPGIVKIGEISKSEYLAINRPGVAGGLFYKHLCDSLMH